tara:strand:+ start:1709 stop:1906 length:198 start_codon:yes stop_codon:yes gene_type:complete
MTKGEKMYYSVWVGGVEVNDYYFNDIIEARKLARWYANSGYINVFIESYKDITTKERGWRNYKLS